MVMGDSIGDFIVWLKQGVQWWVDIIEVRNVRKVWRIVESLVKYGYLRGYKVEGKGVVVYLKYKGERSVFEDIRLVSSISRRIYCTKEFLVKEKELGHNYLVSTSDGLKMVLLENRNKMLGGELILKLK